MIDKKFNRLTVIAFSHYDKRNRKHYLCQCDCGIRKTIQGSLLKSGNTKSCGCLSKERKAATALPGSLGAMRQVIAQNYVRAGKRREWHLTEDEFYLISQRDCHYCGQPPSQIKRGQGNGKDFKYNGIDRIDSKKEYTTDNVVPCCKQCNIAKSDTSLSDFYIWAKRLNAMADQWGIL